jgi:hypothetical protein
MKKVVKITLDGKEILSEIKIRDKSHFKAQQMYKPKVQDTKVKKEANKEKHKKTNPEDYEEYLEDLDLEEESEDYEDEII